MRISTKSVPLSILAVIVFLVTPVHAQERGPGQEGSVALGYVGTTGNTETQTFEGNLRYTLRTAGWVHGGQFQALFAQQDSETQGERYVLDGKSDYRVGERRYLYGTANYTDDRFTGYNYQASVAGGYGHYFANRDEFLLEAYGGLGYRHNEISGEGSEGEAMISLGQNLEYAFTEETRVTQRLRSEVGDELTSSRFEVALVSTIIGELSTQIGFQVRHLSRVPGDREKTDTQTSISLVYDF